jgi:hypothetical protein
MSLLEEGLLPMKERVFPANTLEIPALFGSDGELVLARVLVEPRHLEDLLEGLAGLDFPVNPELHHRTGSVVVEFPAYAGHVEKIRNTLQGLGFDQESLDVFGMLHSAAAS